MNHVFAIARREVAEKRIAFLAAAAIATAPFIAALTVHDARTREDLFSILGTCMSAAFAVGLAAILGATIVGKEITERRISFYYSKPVSGAAIWFGKLTAAAVMVVSTLTIILLPAMLAVRGRAAYLDLPILVEVTLAASLAAFLIVHAISTSVRSRSPWILLDFALTIALGAACDFALAPMGMGGAMELLKWVGGILFVLFSAALIGAGAWQLSQGRADRRQSHRAFARFLWIAVGGILVLCYGFTWWVVSATPNDIEKIWIIDQPSNGNLAVVGGSTRHRLDYVGMFLINTENGRFERLGTTFQDGWRFSFTDDGSKLIWPRRTAAKEMQYEIVERSVAPGAKVQATGFTFFPQESRVFVSPDGNRLASIDRGGLFSVYDVPTQSSLGSGRVAANDGQWAYFDGDQLHIITDTPTKPGLRSIQTFLYDIKQRATSKVGEIQVEGESGYLQVSPRRSVLLEPSPSGGRRIYDLATGQLVAASDRRFGLLGCRLLADGRLLLREPAAGQGSTIAVIGLDNAVIRRIDVGLPDFGIRDEVAPGKVIVTEFAKERYSDGPNSLLVDVDQGTVLRREKNLTVQTHPGWGQFGSDPRVSIHNRPELGFDAAQSLLRWNPATGGKAPVTDR